MRRLRAPLTLLVVAALAVPAGIAAPASANAPSTGASRGLAVRVGQAKALTHIDFPGGGPSAVRREGADIVLSFPHGAPSADLARLIVDTPQFLSAAKATPRGGGLELRLTLADGADARLGRADGASFVNLFPKPVPAVPSAAPPASAAKDQAPTARADAVPVGGVVRMQADVQSQNLVLRFPWRAPVGAAVFRRGDTIWMVFDAKAAIDVSAAPRGAPQIRGVLNTPGADYAAVRIAAPETTLATASAAGGVWTLTLGPAATPAGPVKLSRDDATGAPALRAEVAGATGVFWIADPAVGDRIAVVTALAPSKGLAVGRSLVGAALIPSAQGLAVVPRADDLQVASDGEVVRISRPRGLVLSPDGGAAPVADAGPDLPEPAAMPALIDFATWSRLGPDGFLPRYDKLFTASAQEEAGGKAAGMKTRLALARFLIGSELSFEGLGVLDMIGRADPTMLSNAEYRGLRGAARAMAGRYKDAEADFSSPVLSGDPASALWRGYVAVKVGDMAGARQQFVAGRRALDLFAPKWRARFARADAEAALALGDLATARNELILAGPLSQEADDLADQKLDQARLAEASNQPDQALALYDQAAASGDGAISAPAVLHAVSLRLARGAIQPPAAEATLESLRFRWRGDATELDTVRAVAKLYLAQGRYREALEALRSANGRLTDLPASVAVSSDLSGIFKALFLDGQADGLQPIQALGLFYDFRDFTPIGADGDQMVRKLARRLVDVDLLDQAAQLLKYQADQRLDGVPRAEVSTDLAMIDLMDRKPQDALDALNASRTTLLPTALNQRRRAIEARAWLQLGQFDHASEILVGEKSPEADALRAEIAWRQHAWTTAGPLLEAGLGDRWKQPGPLSGDEQTRLVRAGVAYSLANDDKALARLRDRFGVLADASGAPNALKVALAGVNAETLAVSDFARAASDDATFAGWVEAMKKRFASEPAPFSTVRPAAAPKPLVQAAAAPPPSPAKPKVKQGA